MTEKRLFPGMTKEQARERRTFREAQEALERRRALSEEHAKATRKTQLERDKETSEAYRRYGVESRAGMWTNKIQTSAKISGLITALGVMIGGLAYISSSADTYEDEYERIPGDYEYGYNSDGELEIYNYAGGWNKTTYKVENEPSKFSKITLQVSVGMLAMVLLQVLAIYGLNRKARKIEGMQKSGIRAMLDIAKQNPDIKIDERALATLLEIAPAVVSRMSEAEAVYFEMLMDGHLEIIENKTFYDMAVAIMEGWLRKHPKDMERVLTVFEQDSIPQGLIQKYGSRGAYGS